MSTYIHTYLYVHIKPHPRCVYRACPVTNYTWTPDKIMAVCMYDQVIIESWASHVEMAKSDLEMARFTPNQGDIAGWGDFCGCMSILCLWVIFNQDVTAGDRHVWPNRVLCVCTVHCCAMSSQSVGQQPHGARCIFRSTYMSHCCIRRSKIAPFWAILQLCTILFSGHFDPKSLVNCYWLQSLDAFLCATMTFYRIVTVVTISTKY